MLDFAKLMDPAEQARIREQLNQESAKLQAQAEQEKSMLTLCQSRLDELSDKEASFVRSVSRSRALHGLSPAQLKWLTDIHTKLTLKA